MKICEICKKEITDIFPYWYNWNNRTYHWECIKKENEKTGKLYNLGGSE